jgi:hypothetical protein
MTDLGACASFSRKRCSKDLVVTVRLLAAIAVVTVVHPHHRFMPITPITPLSHIFIPFSTMTVSQTLADQVRASLLKVRSLVDGWVDADPLSAHSAEPQATQRRRDRLGHQR